MIDEMLLEYIVLGVWFDFNHGTQSEIEEFSCKKWRTARGRRWSRCNLIHSAYIARDEES